MRLLDVGCGWGSMAIHAAAHYDAAVVGITISASRPTLARERVAEAGLDRPGRDPPAGLPRARAASVRRDLVDRHVRARRARQRSTEYFEHAARRCSCPTGRLLNHAISLGRRLAARAGASFVGRYVFPDGELIDVGDDACWRWSGPGSRCATSSRCASTTPARCGRGSPTWRRTGTTAVAARRRRHGRGSGGCTWPASAIGFDDGEDRASTRCSASCRRPRAPAPCPRPAPVALTPRSPRFPQANRARCIDFAPQNRVTAESARPATASRAPRAIITTPLPSPSARAAAATTPGGGAPCPTPAPTCCRTTSAITANTPPSTSICRPAGAASGRRTAAGSPPGTRSSWGC